MYGVIVKFTAEEYEARLEKTRASMNASGIDILVLADPANQHYLTGYDGWSFYTPQVVIVALKLKEPICIVRGIDANGARVTTSLPERNIYGYPDDYVQSELRHPYHYIGDIMVERGLETGVVALEMDAYYFSPAGFNALQSKLPNVRFTDSKKRVNRVRSIKSATEIEFMRRAGRLAEKVMQRAYDVIAPGVRQCDAVAEIYQAGISGFEDFGGDYTSLVPMLPTGRGTSTPHLTWSDEPFSKGEATILELAGCYKHYHCPMARTLHLGSPPQHLTDTAKIVLEGLSAALDSARPGVLCEHVEAAWRSSIGKYGLTKESRIGYSTGVNYPPDWGEHTMSLRPGDKTELKPNMTLHMIPGIWKDDWGIEISECFLVTETGAEPFCSFPRPLYVKD